MGDHALLTARDIHGPYMQLLTNLQGENGEEWLKALNFFLRKEEAWFDETEFFFRNKSVFTSPEFRSLVDVRIRPVSRFAFENFKTGVVTQRLVAPGELYGYMGSKYIKHTMEFPVSLQWIAMLITEQLEGNKGPLLTDGNETMFPVLGRQGLVFVSVSCDIESPHWLITATPFDQDGIIKPGNKVFYRHQRDGKYKI